MAYHDITCRTYWSVYIIFYNKLLQSKPQPTLLLAFTWGIVHMSWQWRQVLHQDFIICCSQNYISQASHTWKSTSSSYGAAHFILKKRLYKTESLNWAWRKYHYFHKKSHKSRNITLILSKMLLPEELRHDSIVNMSGVE